MLLPNRHLNTSGYRYGFQGQEMDNEIKGEGNSLNYRFRMHDPRVGRFFAVDPLAGKYPYLTPYQFSSNQPIHTYELEGLESRMEFNLASGKNATEGMWELDLTDEERVESASAFADFLPIYGDAKGFIEVFTGEDAVTGTKLGYWKYLGLFGLSELRVLKILPEVGTAFRGTIKVISSKVANSEYLKSGKFAPYKRGSEVLEFSTETNEQFVRVFNDANGNTSGKWMARKSELLDANGNMLSPEKIKNKLGLENVPNKIQDVNVPKGTKMRTGTAAEKTKWKSKGGGTQYELLDKIPESSFGKGTDLEK